MFKKKKISNSNSNFIKINSKNKNKNKNKIISTIIGFIGTIFISIIGINVLFQLSGTNINLEYLLGIKDIGFNLEEVKTNTTIKSTDGKTNILILGRGGEENDAPELTDSIILASINYDKKLVTMLSIPRDLYVEYPTGGEGKINDTYRLGLDRNNPDDISGGIENIKTVVKKLTQEEIHYYINLDFEGFRKIIDTIGGIDVDVPESITDTTYPGPNYSYITFHIDEGLQTLDGETALRYARSRHSTSDFDRSLRQQLIIKALKEKALSLGIISSPSKIRSIYNIAQENIQTDLDLSQIINLALFAKDIPKDNIFTSNLNTTCEVDYLCSKGGFLYTPIRAYFDGASVLLQDGAIKDDISNYTQIQRFSNIVFNYAGMFGENLKINVFNSTNVGGLAGDISSELVKYGFNIPDNAVGTVKNEEYPQSKILYYTADGHKPATVSALEEIFFGGSQLLETPNKYSTDADVTIEIVIGDDYKSINL